MEEIMNQFEVVANFLLKWLGILGLEVWPTLLVWIFVAGTRKAFSALRWDVIISRLSEIIHADKAAVVKDAVSWAFAAAWGIVVCWLSNIDGVAGFKSGTILAGIIYGASAVMLNIVGSWVWEKNPWRKKE